MKHGLNTDQDRRQGIGEDEEEATDGNAGLPFIATDKARIEQEFRKRDTPSFRYLTPIFFALFAVLIRVQSVFHQWL